MRRPNFIQGVQARLRTSEGWLAWLFLVGGLLLTVKAVMTGPLFLRDIGIIIMIAGLATLAVERQRIITYTRAISEITAKKIEEIRTASMERILKGVLPEEFFALLSDVILEQKFLRPNQKLDETLVWHDNSREYLVPP